MTYPEDNARSTHDATPEDLAQDSEGCSWSLDLRFWQLNWSAGVAALHGVAADFLPTIFEALAFINPPDAVALVAAVSACVRGDANFELNVGLRTATGVRKRARITGACISSRPGPSDMLVGRMLDLGVEPPAAAPCPQDSRASVYSSGKHPPSTWDWEVFAYSVPHELGSPVAAMSAFVACLEVTESKVLSPAGLVYLQGIRKATDQMSGLITALLGLAPLTARPLRCELTDLSALARDAVDLLRATDPARQVSVTIQPDVRVNGDPDLLRQVLFNLFSNAWKFTAHKPRAQVAFSAIRQGPQDVFSVRDNGIGFEMRHADGLFTAFHRLHRREEFDGSGIGLAVVRRIIDRHGGRVWAEAAIHAGATFHFTLDGSQSHADAAP